jgi:hypothetical protein
MRIYLYSMFDYEILDTSTRIVMTKTRRRVFMVFICSDVLRYYIT